jgi:hypothetical protein
MHWQLPDKLSGFAASSNYLIHQLLIITQNTSIHITQGHPTSPG